MDQHVLTYQHNLTKREKQRSGYVCITLDMHGYVTWISQDVCIILDMFGHYLDKSGYVCITLDMLGCYLDKSGYVCITLDILLRHYMYMYLGQSTLLINIQAIT